MREVKYYFFGPGKVGSVPEVLYCHATDGTVWKQTSTVDWEQVTDIPPIPQRAVAPQALKDTPLAREAQIG